jgi:hypothetical protein
MLTGQGTCQSVQTDVAGPYDDTWQVHTGHMASSGSDTCQTDLAFLEVRLDQSRGDTCHH